MDKRKQLENIQGAFTQMGDVLIRVADAEIMTAAISKIRAVGHALQVEIGKELGAETSNGPDEEEQQEATKPKEEETTFSDRDKAIFQDEAKRLVKHAR